MSGPRWVPFAYGFRPFFLLAGIYAAVAIAIWLSMYRLGVTPLDGLPPQYWHAHEMIYGFIAAAVAGFMLTAVPSWTGSRGFGGRPLQALVLAWLVGRVAFMLAGSIPLYVLAVVELVFLPGVMLTVAPSLLRASNRNTPLLLLLLFFWAGDALFLFGVAEGRIDLSARGLRAGLDLVLVLLTIIGGRIVPAFTRNALRAGGIEVKLDSSKLLNRVAVGLMIAYALADIAAPHHAVTAGIAGAAAIAQLWRLAGWQGWRSRSKPIVWILHLAYLWIPVGLALKALSVFGGPGWGVHWLHALGAGAAGTMILAVMTRASLGHTGRPLEVRPQITLAYVTLTLAVAVRVFGPALLPLDYATTVFVAGALWVLSFLLFVGIYAPILLKPRADGKPG